MGGGRVEGFRWVLNRVELYVGIGFVFMEISG